MFTQIEKKKNLLLSLHLHPTKHNTSFVLVELGGSKMRGIQNTSSIWMVGKYRWEMVKFVGPHLFVFPFLLSKAWNQRKYHRNFLVPYFPFFTVNSCNQDNNFSSIQAIQAPKLETLWISRISLAASYSTLSSSSTSLEEDKGTGQIGVIRVGGTDKSHRRKRALPDTEQVRGYSDKGKGGDYVCFNCSISGIYENKTWP